VVRELGRMGKAVVVSSHILAELADLCTHIAIVDGGRVLTAGTVEEVMRRLHGGRSVRVQVLGEGERLRDLLLTRPGVDAVQLEEGPASLPGGALTPQPPLPTVGEGGLGGEEGESGENASGVATVRFVLDGDEQALRLLLAELIGAGLPVFGFGQDTSGLEDLFLRVTRRLGDVKEESPSRPTMGPLDPHGPPTPSLTNTGAPPFGPPQVVRGRGRESSG
jgi:ABC-2 type transport system ATP-binding protein